MRRKTVEQIKNLFKSQNLISIVWFLFGLQLVTANVTKHSIYYQITGGLFILACFYLLVRDIGVKLEKHHLIDLARKNLYYIPYLIFVFYNILLLLFGNVFDFSNSLGMIKTISINLILYILIFNFLLLANDTDKLLKTYISSMAIANILILIIFWESILAGERLAFSWGDDVSTYQLFGISVRTAGPNGIAYYSAIALLLAVYVFLKQKGRTKYLYLFYIILFVFTIFTTGSRKGLLIIAIGAFFLPLLLTRKGKKFKLLYGLIGAISTIILLFLTQFIPFLYDMIGERLNRIVISIITGEVVDISMDTRIKLIEMATTYISANPIFGYGLDAFRKMGPWGIVTDNNYLDILVSSGFIGLIIYYSYAALVILDYLKIKEKDRLLNVFFMIFLINIFLDFFSVTYFERNFGYVNVMIFYILIRKKDETHWKKTSS